MIILKKLMIITLIILTFQCYYFFLFQCQNVITINNSNQNLILLLIVLNFKNRFLKNKMDVSDFKHHAKFKILVPLYYLVGLSLAIFGPYYCPLIYQKIAFVFFLYSALFKAVQQFFTNFIMIFRTQKVLQKVRNNKNNKPSATFGNVDQQIYHAFVIPSYKEDIDLIAQTLSILAQHTRATSNYLVFLAMEKHEEKSDLKALQLIQTFRQKFKYIDYSLHQIRQFQSKGKASNVSWCVQRMNTKFQSLMIQQQKVFLTIMDADSWAPNIYFDQVQEHIRSNYQNRHSFIYQPPQIYTRNNMQANIVVRTYDDLFSSMHISNLVAISNISYSLSNYTLSYTMVKKIGFWDTVQEAIGEDCHIVLKAFFKLKGQVYTVPIYAPWNQANIVTHVGFLQDLKQKFWQIQRHARGINQINYCICMLMKYQITFRSFLCAIICIQNLINPLVSPWLCLSFVIRSQVSADFIDDDIINRHTIFILFNITNLCCTLSGLAYQIFKRRSNKIIYGIQNTSIIRALQLPIIYTVHIFVLTAGSFFFASFGNLLSGRQYVVASKKYIKIQKLNEGASIYQQTQQQIKLSSSIESNQTNDTGGNSNSEQNIPFYTVNKNEL